MNDYIVFILCKEIHEQVLRFNNTLDKYNISYINICDVCSADIDSNLLDLGFYNLTKGPYIKKPSAWDKAFYYYIQNQNLLSGYKHFFFIEDDVYSKDYLNLVEFIIACSLYNDTNLITKKIRTKDHNPKWTHWRDYKDNFKYPSQSFNPLCRLSRVLINKIIEYKLLNNKFNFHEILIPSMCLEHELSYINYIEDDTLKSKIGKIAYNPIQIMSEITDDKIYHPVKISKDDREKSLKSLLDSRRL